MPCLTDGRLTNATLRHLALHCIKIALYFQKKGHPIGVSFFGAVNETRFAFSPVGRKLRFASVEPSAATLICVAFRWVRVRFQQRINPIVNVSFTMGFIGAGERDSNPFKCGADACRLPPNRWQQLSFRTLPLEMVCNVIVQDMSKKYGILSLFCQFYVL